MTTVTVHGEGDTVGLTFPPDLRDRIGLKAGQRFTARATVEVVDAVVRLANGESTEEAFAAWLRTTSASSSRTKPG